MPDCCVILIEHLREGKSIPIQEAFDPSTLELGDKDLSFAAPISLKGTAYLAEDHLIIQLDIRGFAYLPCSVCNCPVKLPFFMKNIYITKPLSDMHGGKLLFKEDLREAILLEIPSFAECNEGHCLERNDIEHYLKQPAINEKQEENVYFPFNSIDEQLKKK